MELNLISENKLKVILTKEDLCEYRLTFDSIDYENTETRRVFWSILDEAKKKTGFDGASNKIFIQVYSDKKGGAEIFISKINSARKGDRQKNYEPYINFSYNNDCLYNDLGFSSSGQAIYKFDTLNSLLFACSCLNKRGFDGISAVYCNKKFYYLILIADEKSHSFLCEFGEKQNGESLIYYIKEHCTEICLGNAVSVLAKL